MMSNRLNRLKLLFIRLSSFGDIIHTLPALTATRRHYPGAEIHWLVAAKCADLLRDHPDIDRLHQVVPTIPGLLQVIRGLRRENFDVALDFQGLFKSAGLARLSGARRVIGRSWALCRERGAAALYTERIPLTAAHIIRQNLELVQVLGVADDLLSYRLALPSMEVPAIFQEKPVALNVGAGWPTKKYPVAKWGELARRLPLELGRPVVIFWGPGEEEEARAVRRLAPQAQLAPRTTYRQMGTLLQSCAALVSSESGPVHLAVAVGTPTVCLMSVTDPRRNGPLDDRSRVLLPPPPHEFSYRRRGSSPAARIPVAAVLAALQEVLAQAHRDDPSSCGDGPAQGFSRPSTSFATGSR